MEMGDPDDTIICGFDGKYLTIGDLRRARAVLRETNGGGDE
jgi:hypothetical protein